MKRFFSVLIALIMLFCASSAFAEDIVLFKTTAVLNENGTVAVTKGEEGFPEIAFAMDFDTMECAFGAPDADTASYLWTVFNQGEDLVEGTWNADMENFATLIPLTITLNNGNTVELWGYIGQEMALFLKTPQYFWVFGMYTEEPAA